MRTNERLLLLMDGKAQTLVPWLLCYTVSLSTRPFVGQYDHDLIVLDQCGGVEVEMSIACTSIGHGDASSSFCGNHVLVIQQQQAKFIVSCTEIIQFVHCPTGHTLIYVQPIQDDNMDGLGQCR